MILNAGNGKFIGGLLFMATLMYMYGFLPIDLQNSVLVRAVLLLLDDERVFEYPVLGSQNQITPTTFLLKYPYQARNVSGHVYLCSGFNFVSYFDFSIVFWNCSASVIFFFHFITGNWLNKSNKYPYVIYILDKQRHTMTSAHRLMTVVNTLVLEFMVIVTG